MRRAGDLWAEARKEDAMPKGFDQEFSQPSGGGDFFDLKDGETAIIEIMDEPFILDVHNLPDATSTYGNKAFPCGAKDMNACVVCEDTTGKYDGKAKTLKSKVYLPIFVNGVVRKDGTKESINEARVWSGGARLYDGLMAFYRVQKEFGSSAMHRPLVAARSGSDSSTSYSIQAHPNPAAKIDLLGAEPIDVEQVALNWIEKSWADVGYKPEKRFSKPASATPVPAASASARDETDPFENLPPMNASTPALKDKKAA